MTPSSSERCVLEVEPDGVATITLNRPERLNAFNEEMKEQLISNIAHCESDDSVRCVVVTGAGDRGFCTGADVMGLLPEQNAANDPNFRARNIEGFIKNLKRTQDLTVLKLHRMRKPTIAAVNGYAIGAGAALALSCDIRLFSGSARLSSGFRNVAVGGDLGGPYFLTKIAGTGVARELMFTGEMIDATRAEELRIANRVFPSDSFRDEVSKFASGLANGPVRAFGRMKQNLCIAEEMPLQDALDWGAVNQRLSLIDAEHFEAAQAFAAKRAPRFS